MAEGHVALVGGGPAPSELITVRGRELLEAADVVVADRLGPRGLLAELGEHVEVVEVGKAPGRQSATQDEINELLVARARAGLRVVRLKGGDPYVLGRGGEEREHCRAHGVDVEVVPGITSASAVPAAAGIPLTHRGLARGFTVITGHEDLDVVPRSDQHTLVILMGVSTLPRVSRQLMADGHDPETPVGVVESGGTDAQRVTLGRLRDIAETADRRQVANPAVIVVGAVVTLADGWTDAAQDTQDDSGQAAADTAAEAAPTTRRPASDTKDGH